MKSKSKVADLAIKIALMLAAFGICYYIGYGRDGIIDVKLRDASEYYYQNPSDLDRIQDPAVFRASNGFYYLYSVSEDEILCRRSANLSEWSDPVSVYKRDGQGWAQGGLSSPEAVEYQGVFYLFYTAQTESGSTRIGLASCASADGTFTDLLNEPLFDSGYSSGNAEVLIEENGGRYLYFSGVRSEGALGQGETGLYGVSLAEDLRSVTGEPVCLTASWPASGFGESGTAVISHNGRYYLAYTAESAGTGTREAGYAVSDSPLGEFTVSGENPVYSSDALSEIGRMSFVYSPDGSELFLVYGERTGSDGSEEWRLAMDRAVILADGTLAVNGPTQYEQPLPANAARTNLADSAVPGIGEGTAADGGQEASVLNDGVFALYEGEGRSLILSAGENGMAEVTLTFPEARAITSIVIYCGADPGLDFASADILMDDDLQITDAALPTMEHDRALRMDFDEVYVSSITLSFLPKEGQNSVSLSEIMVFGEGT